jgi:hypothetical protein
MATPGRGRCSRAPEEIGRREAEQGSRLHYSGRSHTSLTKRMLAHDTAIVTGPIFIFAGLVKFVFHGWELHASPAA